VTFLDGLLNIHIVFGILLKFLRPSSPLQSIRMAEVRVDIESGTRGYLSVQPQRRGEESLLWQFVFFRVAILDLSEVID
jgi:hypothetical protein